MSAKTPLGTKLRAARALWLACCESLLAAACARRCRRVEAAYDAWRICDEQLKQVRRTIREMEQDAAKAAPTPSPAAAPPPAGPSPEIRHIDPV